MNEKIIIVNNTDRPITKVLAAVDSVIKMGRISDKRTAYCYHTTFEDGIEVSVKKNKFSDTFTVWKSEKINE